MLENKLRKNKKSFQLTVLGSGYVGLPTATLFADAGFNVTAVDINSVIVENINCGLSPIKEPGLGELVSQNVKCGNLKAVVSSEVVFDYEDAVIITVQTPINDQKEPVLSFLFNALEHVGKNLKQGMLVVVCSTIPPGTMVKKVQPLLESLSGLKADNDFFLSYVPERISPGMALTELVENTRLVGGIGPNSTKLTAELFGTICKQLIQTDVTTAEIAKTAENTFRDVNIAFANQLALISEQYGGDVTKVIEAANTHPRVNICFPGPGVGGPCLTKDPFLLLNNVDLDEHNLIKIARTVNTNMPLHVVDLFLDALACVNKEPSLSKVAVLGTAYKGDVDDPRSSPSEPIIKMLLDLGAKVFVFDPYCSVSFGAIMGASLKHVITNADCLIVITNHTQFSLLNLDEIKSAMNEEPIIIDCRRIIDPVGAENFGFKYYGIGFGKKSCSTIQK